MVAMEQAMMPQPMDNSQRLPMDNNRYTELCNFSSVVNEERIFNMD